MKTGTEQNQINFPVGFLWWITWSSKYMVCLCQKTWCVSISIDYFFLLFFIYLFSFYWWLFTFHHKNIDIILQTIFTIFLQTTLFPILTLMRYDSILPLSPPSIAVLECHPPNSIKTLKSIKKRNQQHEN